MVTRTELSHQGVGYAQDRPQRWASLPFRGSLRDRRTEMLLRTSLHWPLMVVTAALVTLGVVVLHTASTASENWMLEQLQRVIVGVVVLLVVTFVPIRWLAHFSLWVYGATVALLVLVEIVGWHSGGSQRWINLGFTVFQPSEMARLVIVMTIAWWFGQTPWAVRSVRLKQAWVGLGFIIVPWGLIFVQPDLGTATVFATQGFIVMLLVDIPLIFFGILALVGLVMAPAAWFFLLYDYQKERIISFLTQGSDAFASGYHATQAQIALGSGGIWGRGFLEGTQSNLDFLPEKHTDFAFVVFAEQFGMVGSVVLIGLYVALVVMMVRVAMQTQSFYGQLLAFGATGVIVLPALINIAMVSSLLPVVGIPLPFISYGGSSLLTSMMAVGFVLNVARHRHLTNTEIMTSSV